MKIRKGIFYRECGNNVYLRNVNTQKDYLLSPTSIDILDYCKATPECSVEEICSQISEIYNIQNDEALHNDILSFVDSMQKEGIIEIESYNEKNDSIQHKIEEYYYETNQLYGACLEITYRCSERCKHCYVEFPCYNSYESEIQNELTFDEYKRIIDELYDLGTIYLLITGGEVCLKKEFIDITRYAINKGMLVNIYTNGISMTDEQFDNLCDMKVNSVSFSLYGGDAEVHDKITGVPGSFEKTIRRAMMFKCAGIDTYIKSVILKESLPEMDKLIELGNRLNIDVSVSTNLSRINGCDNPCHLTEYAEFKRAATIQMRNAAIQHNNNVMKHKGVFCNSAHITLSIDPYGGVHPCVAFKESAGNVREQSIREIRENSSLFNYIRELTFSDFSTDCQNCEHLDYCHICVGHCFDQKNKIISPYKDICMTAAAVHDMINEKHERRN